MSPVESIELVDQDPAARLEEYERAAAGAAGPAAWGAREAFDDLLEHHVHDEIVRRLARRLVQGLVRDEAKLRAEMPSEAEPRDVPRFAAKLGDRWMHRSGKLHHVPEILTPSEIVRAALATGFATVLLVPEAIVRDTVAGRPPVVRSTLVLAVAEPVPAEELAALGEAPTSPAPPATAPSSPEASS